MKKMLMALCKISFELWVFHKNMNKFLSDSLYDCMTESLHVSVFLCTWLRSDFLSLSTRSQRRLYEGHCSWISKPHTQHWWKQNQAISISGYRGTCNLITLWTVKSDATTAFRGKSSCVKIHLSWVFH